MRGRRISRATLLKYDFKTAVCKDIFKTDNCVSNFEVDDECRDYEDGRRTGSCSLTKFGEWFKIGWGDAYECWNLYPTSTCTKNPTCDVGDLLTEYWACTPECSDGTQVEQCSTTKPKYCNDNVNLVDNCGLCGGCSDDEVCNEGTGSCELKTAELEFKVTIKNKESFNCVGVPGYKYYFDLNLKEVNNIDVVLNKVKKHWSWDGDIEYKNAQWISGKCGSTELEGNENCFMSNRWFCSSQTTDYSETWYGNSDSVSRKFTISTSEYD